nr:hypothetical protein [Tanacetum cinerariifolium]
QTDEPNLSASTTIVEVLKELPKVSMVNSCLKKLKFHLASFDMLVKERTNATAITEGTWGFEHTKACFRDDIIPFVKALKELFTSFDQCLIDEVTEVQNVFKQTVDIVNRVLYDNVNVDCMNVNACECCVTIESELKKDIIKKDFYDTLFQKYNTLEKHCISLEVNNQRKKEISQTNTLFSSESAPTFSQLFEINDLKDQDQAKETMILKLKEKLHSLSGDVNERNVKRKVEEIETFNIELDHKVTKLVAENKHLKQTCKQLYDSIKSSCVRSKEQHDDLINKVNLKSSEVSDLNASLQEKVLVITALKEQLNKLKGKAVITEAISLNPIDPELLKVDIAPLAPKLRKNRTAHTDYIRHTQEEVATLREIVESKKLLNPLNISLDYACKYTRQIQELLIVLQQTCHCLTDLGTKLVTVTPKNKTKQIRLTEQITKSGKTTITTPPSANIDSNTPMISSTGVTLVSSASGSMSQDNTKKNRIRKTQRKAKKNKLKDHLRTVKSSLNKKNFVYQVKHKNYKKSNEMYYPRFIKVIIHHFMSKDPSIPRRNKINWHFVRDDSIFSTIKVVSRHQNTQQYVAMLPIELTNDEIRNTKAYKEYYAFATGEAIPKPKATARRKRIGSYTSITPPTATITPTQTVAVTPRLTTAVKGKQTAKSLSASSEVARTEAQQLKNILRRSRQETHISQPGGSGTDEGTGLKPGVPDVPTDDSEEELSWNSFDDEGADDQEKVGDNDERDKGHDSEEGEEDDDEEDKDSDERDDDDKDQEVAKFDDKDDTEKIDDDEEEGESDEEDANEETREKETFDLIPKTPEGSEDEGDGEEDQGLNVNEEEHVEEEEEDELYRDVNINHGRGLQATLDVEDTHVTLTPINSDGQQESSSVSS